MLIADGNTCLCFVTCPFYADSYPFSNLVRLRLQAVLSITRAQIAVFSSHNHSCVFLSRTWPFPDGFPQEHATLSEGQLTREGRAFLRGVVQAAKRAQRRLVPVRVAWSVGHERRISYNRKGW